ncbi:MAG TPA: FAD-dependent monooxygenase [Steroidobacteraceae bacterium]|jgi:2-polyprenyl-6-methoxyphenol hydroxylase-like FAD-dependent oxidoreductase
MEGIDGVLVSGAGPVGLVTALKLARRGIRVVVVDAEPAILNQPRACVYHSPVVERLDAMQLLPDLKAVGFTKHAYHYWNREHELLGHLDMVLLRPEDTRYPYNLHLGQPALAAIILKHLLLVPGTEVRWRQKVVAVEQSDDDVTVTLQTEEGERTIRARWLIGADGTHSGVRRALELKFEGTTWPEWFVATNVRFDFEAHGYGQSNIVLDPEHWAVIPKIDASGLWRCTYREHPGTPEEEVRRRLPERYTLFAPGLADCQPEAVSPYRVHDRCVETFRVGRVLMAGDAAHVVNPVGGLGLTSGLLDAIMLGDTLGDVIEGRLDARALDAYAAERRRVFLEVVSPMAQENRRRIGEADPARRRADIERLRYISDDPVAGRQALLAVFQIVGRGVRELM